MPVAKVDRRTERTRQALMTAFVDLVLSRGYADLTVEEIAAHANIGRSTFYVHYAGKEELLRQSMKRPSSFLAVIVGGDVNTGMIVPILDHFKEQRLVNKVFFSWPIRPIWVSCLAELIEPRLNAVQRLAGARPLIPPSMIAMQLAESQLALITNWLTRKPACRADTIAQALIAGTRAHLNALLQTRLDTPIIIPGERLRVVSSA